MTTQFGPSGRMRERIEKGERVDLFTSADIGHARKLMDEGKASVMAMFARNAVCLLSPPKFGATTETVVDKLLSPSVRFGMSPPKIDPLGDYTIRLFEMIDHLRPGSAAALESRAVVLDTPPGAAPPKSGDEDADAILSGRVDASIVYCSARDLYARLVPRRHSGSVSAGASSRPAICVGCRQGRAAGSPMARPDHPFTRRTENHG